MVPWTLIPEVPPTKGEYALSTEAFCGVVAETSLEAADEGAFIDGVGSDCAHRHRFAPSSTS